MVNMNNNIVVNIQKSESLYQIFKDHNSLKNIPKIIKLDKTLTINENLNNLSLFALHPSTTIPVFYSFEPIFLDLMSRWISNPTNVEFEYNRVHMNGETNQISGSVILSALSRLIGLCNESLNLIEYFITKVDFFSSLINISNTSIPTVHHEELEHILLAFYRLTYWNIGRFKQYIMPKALYAIMKIEDTQYNVSKYLAVQILCRYLNASEKSQIEMLNSHIGLEDSLKGSYESDPSIDYRFLHLIEAKRLSNFTKLPKDVDSGKSDKFLAVEPKDLNPLVTSICGILVPNLISKDEKTCQNKLKPTDLVPTENSIHVLRQLAHNIQNNKSVMLYGRSGAGKTYLINQVAQYMSYEDSIVKIHLGEQTDAKLLLGTYTSGEKPGTFQWRSGVLTTAVQEGKWVLIEDIDKAPTEVLSVLLTLLEKRELTIPSRGEIIKAKNGFQLISTIRISDDSSKDTIPDLIGLRLWELIKVAVPTEIDLRNILVTKFPLLKNFIVPFIRCYNEILRIYSLSSFISLNKGSHPRNISFRDLMKFCERCNRMLKNEGIDNPSQLLESSVYDNIFAEAVDCFGSAVTEYSALVPLINAIGETLEIPTSRINLFLSKHTPDLINDDEKLKIGRATLEKSLADKALFVNRKGGNNSSFAKTNHSLKLMEQIGVSIQMVEPVLLVGETGTGKTTVVQEVAKMMNKKLTVINVSQQTEAGDLLGGYKPVNTKTVAIPLQEIFENLFIATFSKKKNEKFSQILSKCFNKSQWKNVIRLWFEALRMAKDLLAKSENDSDEEAGGPKKKRKLRSHEKSILLDKWFELEVKIKDFEIQSSSLENSFVFNFVEGSLVQAVRNGDWLLLDEINLASSDTLESIADLLSESLEQRSILLTERGDVESIKAHEDFRIFGCMNPSTDVGKKDLPLSIRSKFSEIYVHSPDRDIQDLLSIIDKYINRYAVGDEWVGNDIAELYLEAKRLAESNKIVDGANQKPHFSIRTLTRTLIYVRDIVSIYGLRRSLYEGFCMAFLTLLDVKSEEILKPIIVKYTIGKLKNAKSVMSQCPPPPANNSDDYVQFRHYWMKRGPGEPLEQPDYIITPFVEKNLLNLVRATAGRRFPVLVQGPTSAGKTSMIKYLANITGHKFVRINNHEHTDLQEYLGTFVSDSTGKLIFREGVLVEALRKGHWIVLDELNLAPTDVLEALNRLLDDNRELFIPETQEIVHPHPDFMIFATQNPPGLYGGRKMLSRAFRNRFLELHFDDIPQDELEIILRDRCKIAPTYGKKIVEVYRQLSFQRQSTRLFEQKNSFATLRDLFRWALRDAVGYEELAANGYMLLAERVRKADQKRVVKETIEKVMKVKLDMDSYYEKLENKALMNVSSSIVWTKAMRRLAVLVFTSMKYNEPLLLVGETGCGKTTVCQIITEFLRKELITVNAHQNTETGDLLGAQRPVRNRFETQSTLFNNLINLFETLGVEITLEDSKLDDLIKKYNSIASFENVDPELISAIEEGKRNSVALFEWNDGPLIHAMKDGNIFLLDEISLADDSVLERLNSVLEPERSILLAEKGVDDAFITAHEGFEFLATMNPGGDYGKKELSPALRNRFTEIWVPSMDDFNDVRQIVSSKLNHRAKDLCEPLVQFSEWYGKKFGAGQTNSGVISLRDILAWVQFINSCADEVSTEAALLHGASMVFIDALGTNNTAYLAENEMRLKDQKLECVQKLSEFCQSDLLKYYTDHFTVDLRHDMLSFGLFSIPRVEGSRASDSFNLHAPTTAANAMRVVRAMQVHKPILLEGSPGVGKTSLVSALAKATGNSLIRINLSEQTDLVDLFGSDAPAEGGKAGEFTWRDAPFLRAMQKGEWVLLDEMNLASQSVLEGLNACLDHRGEAYIPELDKSFTCHPDFVVFAAQNPQYQGGGRKGLPKSFVNRFTVVYVDVLKSEDLNMISQHLFPNIDGDTCSKIIRFMSELEREVVVKRMWGSSGGPWEFNLRDTLRWLELFSSKNICGDLTPGDFLNMIVCERFRSKDDRMRARTLFESIFGQKPNRDNLYSIGDDFVQVGSAIIERKQTVQHLTGSKLIPLQCNFPFIESAIHSINQNLPLILAGPTNSGKTELIRFIADIVGAKIDEFAMNSDVDSMDILGGYEQVDLTRAIVALTNKVRNLLVDLAIVNLCSEHTEPTVLLQALELINYIDIKEINIANYNEFHSFLKSYLSFYSNDDLMAIYKESQDLQKKTKENKSVKFEWFDGLLVKAVEKGNWLILDNANLCSPSVLDRLNSLLETNGTLIINECSSEDGKPRTITPHPNFRLFLTMDPKHGELSRAMRNRGIELYMDSIKERISKFDSSCLGFPVTEKSEKDLEEKMKNLEVNEVAFKPSMAFIAANLSTIRPYALLNDIFDRYNQESKNEIINVILGIIPFICLQELEAWRDSICSSAEFDSQHKSFSNDLIVRLKFLEEEGILTSLSSMYYPVQNMINGANENVKNFVNYQSLNPLVNYYVHNFIAEEALFFDSPEPTFLFETVSGILESSSSLNHLEEKSMHGKISDLSYIERSAAFQLGRNIKKVPRLDIYRLVKSGNEFILKAFKSGAKDMVFSSERLYRALFDLHVIWKSLLDTASEQDESKLRVFKDLILSWIENYSTDPFIVNFVEELKASVDAFGEALVLKSGFSMAKIWEQFRMSYPLTENTWNNAEILFGLAKEFDIVAQEQLNDTNAAVSNLRTAILGLYQDIVLNNITDDDFSMIADDLKSGISKLKDMSNAFIYKRHNEFKYEFSLLSNFVECSSSNGDDNTELLSLATLSGRSTFSLLRSSHSDIFNPYPSVFDSLWTIKNGKCHSLVPGLFSYEIISSSLSKSQKFSSFPGKNLQQNLQDIKIFTDSIVNNSRSILKDQSALFSGLLISWFAKIIEAHIMSFDPDDREVVTNLVKESFTKESIEPLIDIIQRSDNKEFIDVCERFMFPSLFLAISAHTLQILGKAWILFSCGAIQLYVPSSAYDPAIREHVIYKKFMEQQASAQDMVLAWESAREVLYGDSEIHAETVMPILDLSKGPKKPRVFRRTGLIDRLFEEWKAFMDSTINVDPVMNLLSSAEELVEASGKMIDIFHNNSSQFLLRLDQNFLIYSDLNDILRGYVYGLKFGFDLLSMGIENSKTMFEFSDVWPINVSELADSSKVLETFPAAKEFCKSLGADSIASEHIMLFFIRVCFAHKNHTSNNSLDSIVQQAFQSLYYRWSLRRMKAEEESSLQSSLYKYSDPSTDIEDDFKSLFPDHEEVMNVEIDSSSKNDSFEEVYVNIGKIYVDAFLSRQQDDMPTLVNQGSELCELLANYKEGFKSQSNNSPILSALITRLTSSFNELTSNNFEVDFYRGNIPSEFKKAMSIVSSVHMFTLKLLEQWPEHATLQNIARACDEFLAFPMHCPISRLLQKIEQIYTYISEWEKYAHSQVSLKSNFDELTQLIVSWRKLELSAWKSLLKNEDELAERSIGKWWFHLFETIIIPNFSNQQKEDMPVVKLLAALNVFMSQTTYGEFIPRLNLIRAFTNHIGVISPKEVIHDALANLVTFYEQFVSSIEENISNGKKKLEKDISEVILLASWKDVNIDALKQSARRSHNNLYKIVRKYRALLATSVSGIIEQGIPETQKVLIVSTDIPSVRGHVFDSNIVTSSCQEISSWNERPRRLQNITMIDKNMDIYVSRIINEELPSFYEYAKELIEEMERLRKETPKELKDDNKKLIAALKTQKRKLLSDTLRELRRIGLKTSLRADIHKIQSTVNAILVNSKSFESSMLEGCDKHYFRVLDIIPRLKAAVSNVAEDVPQVDADKGLAAAENLVFSLITIREPLFEFATSVSTMDELYTSFEYLTNSEDFKDTLARTTILASTKLNLFEIENILFWLPKLLDYALHVIHSSFKFSDSISTEIYYKAKANINELLSQLSGIDKNVTKQENIEFIEKFRIFYQNLIEDLNSWKVATNKLFFVSDTILAWIEARKYQPFVNSSTSITEVRTLEDIERAFRELSTFILLTVQKVTESQSESISENDDNWLILTQLRMMKYIKSMHSNRMIQKMQQCFNIISKVEHNSETSRLTSALASFTLPLIRHYYKLALTILDKTRSNYTSTSHATFILTSSLHTLATKGFCSPEPPSDQKENDNLQDGTGLGDGDGANNNSKDIEQDDDLTEDAQQPNEDNKDKDDKEDEDDNAVDMEGDMAGDLEEASDQEKDDAEDDEGDDEELDEEVDDIDDLDPNAIDEKMWDEEAKEDNKEKDSDKMPENSTNDDDNMEAKEDEEKGSDDKNKNDETKSNDQEENEDNSEDENNDEEGDDKDVGEQDDEVQNKENEQLEEHVPESEVLDLPEDMNLDSGDEEKEENEDEGDDFEDKMDIDLDDEKNEVKDEDQDKIPEEDHKTNENEDGEEDEEEEEEEEEEENDDENGENDQNNDVSEEPNEEGFDSDEDVAKDKGNEEEDEEDKETGGNDKDLNQETAEGVDGADDDAANEDMDMESAVKQESGEKGDGSDNQVIEENDDIGATGGASADSNQQDMEKEDKNTPDDARDMAKESLKQLGDSLKEFHRRRQEIKESSIEEKQDTNQSANERPDEFQHVDGDNADFDTQALGAADKDQTQAIDEENAIDDDEEVANEEKQEVKEEAEEIKEEDKMDIDDNVEEIQDQKADPEADFEGKTKGIFMNEERLAEEDDLIINSELNDMESRLDEEMDIVNDKKYEENDDIPPIDIEDARELWKTSELATQELASGLCEQLRLILEPTLATKLRGDYKTGKRLNMKRIIPYIASDFRKDKIWLRRTKPSKRQYQIMIAVDDSKSMSESKSTELAFHSIALVSKALTQLESGGLSIVKFGESVKVVHPFDKPFNNQQTGSNIFLWFDFQQTKTDIKKLCTESLKIFETAKSTSNDDLWQLQIIISDGVCEDHDTIQRLVRKAREEKIMLVFVIVDGINSSESILDMSQVNYETDPSTGAMSLKVNKYLDTFPFEFFVVVRNINELPEMLSLVLRQYFTEVASI